MPPNRIVELAAIIQEHTKIVDDYFTSHNLPTPSFDISYPPKVPVPREIQQSQDAVLDASDELTALMLGPAASLIAKNPFHAWASIQAIERFNVAKSFPPGTTSTFAAIAAACSLSESDTRRILRHAMSNYVFREPAEGTVAHTAASKALAEMAPLAHVVGFMSSEMWPSASRLADAMEKWPDSEEPNQTGFAVAFDSDVSMFDAVPRDPLRARRMAGAMSFLHSGPGYSPAHLIEAFDWGDAARGLLVDVGGGRGTVATDIARALPGIRCVVQDLPDVIASAEIPEDLRDGGRLQFMAHHFFHEQPVKGADVYHLRWVLHDWPDKYAVQILQNLIPALKKGARVLVSELCLPQPCGPSPYKQRIARGFDLAMKAIQNAKERDPSDWKELFESADSRFTLQEIVHPSDANLSIICAVWEGESTI